MILKPKIMMKRLLYIPLLLMLAACHRSVNVSVYHSECPPIVPDYTGVTLPPNMVAPVFGLPDSCDATALRARFEAGKETLEVNDRAGLIRLSPSQWGRLCQAADSMDVTLHVCRRGKWEEYAPFTLYISADSIDAYLTYRLIEPGYETWNEMGIYQRCLLNYDERPLITNAQTNYGCMNCHSFCRHDANRMLFHLRVDYGGTYVVKGGKVKKLNTKTPQTISALVYPSWHPGGRFVAFSTNTTKQMFHTTDPNRVEVMDYASDVVVFDDEREEIFTAPCLSSAAAFETFPSFSPDGRRLYFCSADSVAMPADYRKVRYSLCAVDFDPDSRRFGSQVDTLYSARTQGGSVSFPRVSPDGRFLMYTLSDYGNFSIWHTEADLHLIRLADGQELPLDAFRSDASESYHSWSSNSRWTVFSSRRMDGLYTRPFIGHIDAEGLASKPFPLPQETPDHYLYLLKSFNIPEFTKNATDVRGFSIQQTAKGEKGVDIKFVKVTD
jgi:hypothetical protein